MSGIAHIILPSIEKFQKVVLDQQGTAQDAHNLKDGSVQLEVVLDDGDKAICDDGDVDLYPYGILAVAPETFDAEMLLDPFEEKLDLPAVTVQQGDVLCRKVEVVGVVHEGTSEVSGVIDNPAQYSRVVARVALPRESDGLVKEHTILPVKHVFSVEDLEFWIPFLPDDKECAAEMDSEEPCEVEVATVEDIAGVGFVFNPVHGLAVVDFGIGDSVEYGNLGDDVDLGVDFNAGLCAAEEGPTEYGHAEVDGSGIHGIEPPVELEFLGNPPSLRERYHIKGKLLEDSRFTEHIGFGECVPDHCRVPEPKLITSLGVGSSNICKFSECSASEQLSENEDKKVIPVRKTPILCPVIEFGYNSAELPLRQIQCDLGEYVSSVVHLCFFLMKTKVRNSSPGQYFSIIKQCA